MQPEQIPSWVTPARSTFPLVTKDTPKNGRGSLNLVRPPGCRQNMWGPIPRDWILQVCNAITKLEHVPDSLKIGIITPLYKGGGKDPLDTHSYRGTWHFSEPTASILNVGGTIHLLTTVYMCFYDLQKVFDSVHALTAGLRSWYLSPKSMVKVDGSLSSMFTRSPRFCPLPSFLPADYGPPIEISSK